MTDDLDYRDVDAWFSWDVFGIESHEMGACGVSGDPERASSALDNALRAAPSGAWGEVWEVELSNIGRRTTYQYVRLVTRHGVVPSSDVSNDGESR